MAIETRTIQVRRGKESELDKSKFLPGEFGSATDTRKVFHAFAPNVVKELASKEDVQGLIDGFSDVVDSEIAKAEQRIESKGQEVLDTIPDLYEEVSARADEAVRTKADAIVCTVGGVTPIAKDSSDDYVRNLKLYGKTTQPTTTGKNLLENTAKSETRYGLTVTINEDKSVTINGTSTGGIQFVLSTEVLPIGSYIINGCDKNGSNSTYRLIIERTRNDSKTWISDIGSGSVVFDIDETVTDMRAYIEVANGLTLNDVTFYPMIRLASITDPTYEPYTGGLPSPSPSYPQPLESKGKWGNLCNLPDGTGTFNGVTWTIKNGEVSAKGTSTESSNSSSACDGYHDIEVKKGTYTISGYQSNGITAYARVTKADGTQSYYYNETFTLDGTETNLRVYCQVNAGVTVDTTIYPMLNEGTIALPYRPYSGQMEIESVVYGKNLLDVFNDNINLQRDGSVVSAADYINKVNEDGSVTVNISASKTYSQGFTLFLNEGETATFSCNVLSFGNGTGFTARVYDIHDYERYKITKSIETLGKLSYTFTAPKASVYLFGWYVAGGTVPCGALINNVQLELGDTATEFEFGKAKQSHISLVGDGLKGIPVTDASLATYTDENGQMWCSDYVDCDRGVLVQRIYEIAFDGTEYFVVVSNITGTTYRYEPKNKPSIYNDDLKKVYCSHLKAIAYNDSWNIEEHFISNDGNHRMVFKYSDITTLEDWKAWLAEQYANGTPVTVQYILETPNEIPLTADEIASYKALHSNYKVTTVMNDCKAYMDVTYNADTETWINNKIEARVASALASLAL